MHGRRAEQVAHELTLRLGSDASSAMLWKQRDPDLEVRCRADRAPCDPSGARTVIDLNGEVRRLVADQAVFVPSSLQLLHSGDAVAEALVLARRVGVPEQPKQVVELVQSDRP